jgi:hypothetical protein
MEWEKHRNIAQLARRTAASASIYPLSIANIGTRSRIPNQRTVRCVNEDNCRRQRANASTFRTWVPRSSNLIRERGNQVLHRVHATIASKLLMTVLRRTPDRSHQRDRPTLARLAQRLSGWIESIGAHPRHRPCSGGVERVKALTSNK